MVSLSSLVFEALHSDGSIYTVERVMKGSAFDICSVPLTFAAEGSSLIGGNSSNGGLE